jgi:hypothetical protein
MPLSQVTSLWALLAPLGAALVLLSDRFFYAAAQKMRGHFWTVAILYGEAATVPLRILSMTVGLVAALPVCSAIMTINGQTSFTPLSTGQLFLLFLSVLFRVLFWPAVGADWAQVGRWEQEVVRRPRGMLWVYAFSPKSSGREVYIQRAAILGRTAAAAELREFAKFNSIPKQALGLLLMYYAVMYMPSFFGPLKTELKVVFLTFCLWTFAGNAVVQNEISETAKRLGTALFLIPAGLWICRLYSGDWPFGFNVSRIITHDVMRLSFLSVVFLLTGRDIARLLDLRPASAPEVGLAPLDRRYSFLKKITQTSQWLAKPSHLLTLFLLLDVLLATLRITVTW